MNPSAHVATKPCPNCGEAMHWEFYETIIEEHHFEGLLYGLEFPMVAHRPGWKCQNSSCEYFEPVPVQEFHDRL